MFESFRSQIRRYRSLGLDVRISELDVRIDDLSDISLEDRLILQASIYSNIVRIAIEEGIAEINIWGIADHDSWLNDPSITGNDSLQTMPLLFDRNNNAKPSYFGLLQGLLLSLTK